jgi:hypothetical protein
LWWDRNRGSKIIAVNLATLMQICGNFGQPAPDYNPRFCRKPEFQPPKHHGMATVFARQRLAPAGESSYNQSEH